MHCIFHVAFRLLLRAVLQLCSGNNKLTRMHDVLRNEHFAVFPVYVVLCSRNQRKKLGGNQRNPNQEVVGQRVELDKRAKRTDYA